jgi:hypothetical protein
MQNTVRQRKCDTGHEGPKTNNGSAEGQLVMSIYFYLSWSPCVASFVAHPGEPVSDEFRISYTMDILRVVITEDMRHSVNLKKSSL